MLVRKIESDKNNEKHADSEMVIHDREKNH